MNNWWRRQLFTYYWVIVLIGVVSSISILASNSLDKRPELGIALAGVSASIVYFVQKQELEESQHFERLFTQFNDRYRQLHDGLQQIGNAEAILSAADRQLLDRYFNLCAEEYLFHSEGRIPRQVWRSWCLGMLYYLKDDRISKLWEGEVRSVSHYGMTREAIQAGAD